jgi:acyl dehydratase
MPDWANQLFWDDVQVGEDIGGASFPMPLHRMIVQAGANLDYASIHHNSEHARGVAGAPEVFANNVFLQGMWERVVRQFIGLDGVIKKIGPFRIKTFTTVGETVAVSGTVERKWEEEGEHLLDLKLNSRTSKGDVVTGFVQVGLPKRS